MLINWNDRQKISIYVHIDSLAILGSLIMILLSQVRVSWALLRQEVLEFSVRSETSLGSWPPRLESGWFRLKLWPLMRAQSLSNSRLNPLARRKGQWWEGAGVCTQREVVKEEERWNEELFIFVCVYIFCVFVCVWQDRTGRCSSCYFLMLEFVFSHIKLSMQKGESHIIVDEISTYPMQWWNVLENFEI